MAELHVYDFDGTLFRSPDPPDGWDGDSWWVAPESLNAPCVPDRPGPEWWVQSTVAQARRSIADPNVWAIVCTGRPLRKGGFAYRVPELVHQAGLAFDDIYLSTSHDTPGFKKAVITKITSRYPDITTVHIWEDRANHLDSFIRHVEQLGLVGIPHLVRESSPPALCKVAPNERVASRWLARQASKDFRQAVQVAHNALAHGDDKPLEHLISEAFGLLGQSSVDFDAHAFSWDYAYERMEWFQALGPKQQKRVRAFPLEMSRLAQWFRQARQFRKVGDDPRAAKNFEFGVDAFKQKGAVEILWLGALIRDSGQDNDAFNHNGFRVIPMSGVRKKDTADCLAALDEAIRLCKAQFPQVLYGKMYITPAISMTRKKVTLAHYHIAHDVMTISLKARRGDRQVIHTILHELGHRYDHKFLHRDERTKFGGLSSGRIHVEEILTPEKAREMATLVVNYLGMPKWQGFNEINALMLDLYPGVKHTPELKKALEFKRTTGQPVTDTTAVWAEIAGLAPAVMNKTVNLGKELAVTPYGGTNPGENFAEGFAHYLMGLVLPHPAMDDFFKELG